MRLPWRWLTCSFLLAAIAHAGAPPRVEQYYYLYDGQDPAYASAWVLCQVRWSGEGTIALQARQGLRRWAARATAQREGAGLSWLIFEAGSLDSLGALRVVQVGSGPRRTARLPAPRMTPDASCWLAPLEPPRANELAVTVLGRFRSATLDTAPPLVPGSPRGRWVVVDEPGLAAHPELAGSLPAWLLDGGRLVVTQRGRAGLGAELSAHLSAATTPIVGLPGVHVAPHGDGWIVDWPAAATASAEQWARLDLALPVRPAADNSGVGVGLNQLAALFSGRPKSSLVPLVLLLVAYPLALFWAGRRNRRQPLLRRWLVPLAVALAATAGFVVLAETAFRQAPTKVLVHRISAESNRAVAAMETTAVLRTDRPATVSHRALTARAETRWSQTAGRTVTVSALGQTQTLQMPARSSCAVNSQDLLQLPGTVDLALRVGDRRISGAVHNGLPWPLLGAWLLTNKGALALGDVAAGATLSLPPGTTVADQDTSRMLVDLVGPGSLSNPDDASRVPIRPPSGDTVLLLARLDTTLRGAQVDGTLPLSVDLTLLQVAGPVAVDGAVRPATQTSHLGDQSGLGISRMHRLFVPRPLPPGTRAIRLGSEVFWWHQETNEGPTDLWLPAEGRLEPLTEATMGRLHQPVQYTDGVLTVIWRDQREEAAR
ncbi:MAG TPA: hypothetical protein DCZ72_04055 [Armatimonadetes bacterium]|nr:hypothetical protein [Armatimonadota bacterium]